VAWWRRADRRPSNTTYTTQDPLLVELLSLGAPNYSGVTVGEYSALGVSAVYRATSLISGTIAGLPMRTVRDVEGTRTRITSFLDDPGAPIGMTAFQWKETVTAHLVLHGNSYLAHVRNGAGGLIGLTPFHPSCVQVEFADVPGGKRFTATLNTGQRVEYDATNMTEIMGLSFDGLRGTSLIDVARNSLGTAIAGDRAAARMFANGALFSGLVSAEEDIDETEVKQIKESLDAKTAGWEHNGSVAVVNRRLKFQPWTMSQADAQWLETREFMVREVARWTGVPATLLMDPGAVSTWGTGVEIQNRGLARYTLAPYTGRIEAALSRLLPMPRFCEFDYAGLERPTPEQEIDLLIKQVQAGLLTVNEARRIRNLPPLDGGDEPRGASESPATAPDSEEVDAA
jgi:HK97 family phage portal protein